MAFIVEDGTGVSGANSYSSVAAFTAYCEFRFDVSAKSELELQTALVRASSDWVDGYHKFSGVASTETQGLFFPTVCDGLPDEIIEASQKAAILYLQNLLFVDLTKIDTNGSIASSSKKVGPLSKSITYAANSASKHSRTIPDDLTNLLKPYLSNSLFLTRRV